MAVNSSRERYVSMELKDSGASLMKGLIKHHGISKNKVLWYIKEMEWRYNHSDYNLFELLIKYMPGADN